MEPDEIDDLPLPLVLLVVVVALAVLAYDTVRDLFTPST